MTVLLDGLHILRDDVLQMDCRLRAAVPVVPLSVLLLVLLLVEDPKKPWSGIAYMSAVLTVVGIGWTVGRWHVVLVAWAASVAALVISENEPAPAGTCDPACWSTADAYASIYRLALAASIAMTMSLMSIIRWRGSVRDGSNPWRV